jgi:hypothetical protein
MVTHGHRKLIGSIMMPADLPAMFIADARGIDFLNSIATPVDVPVDWISDGQGLVNWLRQAELVPEAQLVEIARDAREDILGLMLSTRTPAKAK